MSVIEPAEGWVVIKPIDEVIEDTETTHNDLGMLLENDYPQKKRNMKGLKGYLGDKVVIYQGYKAVDGFQHDGEDVILLPADEIIATISE